MGQDQKGDGDNGVYRFGLKTDELDVRLGKGIPKGSVVFIEGPEGSGRSILSQRLCYGFLDNGVSVTYVSTEMTFKDFIDQMYSINYQVGPHLLSDRLLYVPVYPLLGQTRTRDDFLLKLVNSPQLFVRDVLIVDSFSSLLNKNMDYEHANSLMGFLKKLTRMDKTVVLTSEAGLPNLDPLRLSADVYLDLVMNTRGGVSREIHVKRFLRARGQVEDQMKYRIEPKSGMVIEITDLSG
ncbi:MAG: ATPase domain-containing protein [Methanomassiliicoccales archaeon]|jgi:flagellar protein FlaH